MVVPHDVMRCDAVTRLARRSVEEGHKYLSFRTRTGSILLRTHSITKSIKEEITSESVN